MKIVAIDPAPKESAFVLVDPITLEVYDKGILKNEVLIQRKDLGFGCINLFPQDFHHYELAIERVRSMGQVAGNSLFDTSEWIGRFEQAFVGEVTKIPRIQIKVLLCGKAGARDSDVREAVLQRYQQQIDNDVLMPGGGKNPIQGTKSKPGPLYGIKTHLWQALGAALVHIERPDKL